MFWAQSPASHHWLITAAMVRCSTARGPCAADIVLAFAHRGKIADCGPQHVLPILDKIELLGLPSPFDRAVIRRTPAKEDGKEHGQKPGSAVAVQSLEAHQATWHFDSHNLELASLNVSLWCPHIVAISLSSQESVPQVL
jgi:hypothetical protein